MSRNNDDTHDDHRCDPSVSPARPPFSYPACVQRPHTRRVAASRPHPYPAALRYEPPIDPALVPYVMRMIAKAEIRLGRLHLGPFVLRPPTREEVEKMHDEEWSE